MNPGLICSLDQVYSITRLATLMSMVVDQIVNDTTTSLYSRSFRLLPQVMVTFSFVSKSSYALLSQGLEGGDTFALSSHISVAIP